LHERDAKADASAAWKSSSRFICTFVHRPGYDRPKSCTVHRAVKPSPPISRAAGSAWPVKPGCGQFAASATVVCSAAGTNLSSRVPFVSSVSSNGMSAPVPFGAGTAACRPDRNRPTSATPPVTATLAPFHFNTARSVSPRGSETPMLIVARLQSTLSAAMSFSTGGANRPVSFSCA
jgi:hypothetical protein